MTAGPSTTETRTFRATQSNLAEIDCWMEAVGARWDVAERTIFRARVCVAELVANAIEHGGASAERDTVTITLRRQGRDIRIEHADTTEPFNPAIPNAPPRLPADGMVSGGRGLRLLHAYASGLSYCHDGKRNVVRFSVTAGQALPKTKDSSAYCPSRAN